MKQNDVIIKIYLIHWKEVRMKNENKKKFLDTELWAIRLCALAMVSGIYLAVSGNEEDKKDIKRAAATTACSVLGGIGMGMAYNRMLNKRD